jgi:protein TonB
MTIPASRPASSNAERVIAGTAALVHAAHAPRVMQANGVYMEYQTEQAVTPLAGQKAPRYPDALRKANVEGEVLAQFVVNEAGVADTSTFTVLKSTHGLFTEAVRSALGTLRFHPALVGGRPVKQLVQMPFQFNLVK